MNLLVILQNIFVWVFGLRLFGSSPIMPSDDLADPRHWVDIWTTAHAPNAPHLLFPGHEAFPTSPSSRAFVNSTIRQTFRVSLAADTLRVRVSNEYSPNTLPLSGASIALPVKHRGALPGSPAINPNSSVQLTFSGFNSIEIPRGATVLSDPVRFPVEAFSDVSISMYLAAGHEGQWIAGHEGTKTMSWLARGNQVDAPSLALSPTEGNETLSSVEFKRWYYVSSIEAHLPLSSRSVVCFGDSITDQGSGELPLNAYNGWPDVLARRLQSSSDPDLRQIAMINQGISGDQIYLGGLSRFDRDVIARPGVAYLMILMGINDLNNHPDTVEGQAACYDHITLAYSQMISRAHAAGIQVFGSTIMPYLAPPDFESPPDNPRPSEEPIREGNRQRLNHWLRTDAGFDGIFDLDMATRDPEHPQRMRLDFGGRDFVHPTMSGLKTMAEAVDLELFEKYKHGYN